MQDYEEVQIVETENLTAPLPENDLFTSRRGIYGERISGTPEVTICVQAFNRLEKTKRCVEAILAYTQGVDYELLLLNHGSSDGTLDYFRSVEYNHKRIIHVTKNLGPQYGTSLVMKSFLGQYLVLVTNDTIVTKNWVTNMLSCMKSDSKIGMVVPGSSNVSNLQEIQMEFSTYQEMQEKAAAYNRSDPKKWEQRLRVVPITCMIRREVIDLVGVYDTGFYHDFPEDDFSVRIRRAGYKLMVCMDTFVHHDHDFRHGEDKDQELFQLSLETGRKNFSIKYHGLDSWSEMINYEGYITQSFPNKRKISQPQILGVDVMCGAVILQIKNELRRRGVINAEASAFTSEARYFCDLQSICTDVVCDRMERISDFFEHRSFDYIVLGKAVNTYADFPWLLRNLLRALRPAGVLFLKLRNTQDIISYLNMMGRNFTLEEFVMQVSAEQFNEILNLLHVQSCNILSIPHQVDAESQNVLLNSLKKSQMTDDVQAAFKRLMTKEYAYCITK
ncbi:MAG: glycosyltransferase family 2 protein [Oscillospiraceae bacterium]|nr:glycosyltransferase family 2 protein [Oscillospiraceae bacterium]